MFFKKIIYALLFASLYIPSAWALQLEPALQQIVTEGKLSVAFASSAIPPYVYRDANNQLKGFDVELATRIAEALSVKLEPVFAANYNEAVALVANKKAELAISNITRTYERGKYVLFSDPYHSEYLTMIESRKNATATDITREQAIAKYNRPGFIIGVLEGTVFIDIVVKYFPLAKVVVYKDEDHMLVDVDNKKINAAVSDYIMGRAALLKSPEVSLSVTITRVKDWILEDAIVMNSEHIRLMLWLNLFLNTLEQDGTLRAMRIHYFNTSAR